MAHARAGPGDGVDVRSWFGVVFPELRLGLRGIIDLEPDAMDAAVVGAELRSRHDRIPKIQDREVDAAIAEVAPDRVRIVYAADFR